MGVWIEMLKIADSHFTAMSLPLWECGLKYSLFDNWHTLCEVTPLVGVWIEIIRKADSYLINLLVTPLVGVWIEISSIRIRTRRFSSHSPCGSVD